jgi:6-pyruvoyltetrahydropterin/6-carboxytetrahydropterin synthase
MSASYQLKILTDFASAHTLRDYPGACSRMHGHNWKVEVVVSATELDDMGMVIDFKTIKKETNKVCDILDHRYLNDIKPFDVINPTAENLAKYIYQELAAVFKEKPAIIESVTLWETDRACVTYSKKRQ